MQRVGILLATCNGEMYLAEQLDSLAHQSYCDWRLQVSDDGSTDGTPAILGRYSLAWPGRVQLRHGPRAGLAKNFMALVNQPGTEAAYWAFCDQDDFWHQDKIATAVGLLGKVPETTPALYCSRTRVIDVAGNLIGFSPDWQRPPGFGNAIVQNIASGNTMVFNEAARRLLARMVAADVPFHDWLLYLAVTACGGQVLFDHVPRVDYRRHAENALGPWSGPTAQWRRLNMVARGLFGKWIAMNLVALSAVADEMTDEARDTLTYVQEAQLTRGSARMRAWSRSGIYHQSRFGTLLLRGAAWAGRL